jgi:hypothetical protein
VGPPTTDHVLSFVPQGPAGTRGFRQIDGWIDDVLPLLDGQPRRLVLSVPLVPTGSTFASVIAGDGHRRLTKLGAALRAADRGRSVIRLGWESNAAWPRWRAVGHERDYRRAFRAVVRTLRAAAPRLRFEWNLTCNAPSEPPAWYPGDHYVDLVGMDCYARTIGRSDRWSGPLNWLAGFAQQHGKRIAVSEWGTSLNDATLVRTFLCWANQHSVAYHNYWDVQKAGEADTRLERQPEALAAYRANCV